MTKVPRTGRPAYGADIGIVLLEHHPPRPVGDVGNAKSFRFPVHYEVADGLHAASIVANETGDSLERIVSAAKRLRQRGARSIATCCGFLSIWQRKLTETLRQPVATSSLLQLKLVLQLLAEDQAVLVMTADANTLCDQHFEGVGLDGKDRERLIVAGLESSQHFYGTMVLGNGSVDTGVACQEVVHVALNALATSREVGAIVMECTNLPPYSEAVRVATGLPVWDSITLLDWVQQGLSSPSD